MKVIHIKYAQFVPMQYQIIMLQLTPNIKAMWYYLIALYVNAGDVIGR